MLGIILVCTHCISKYPRFLGASCGFGIILFSCTIYISIPSYLSLACLLWFFEASLIFRQFSKIIYTNKATVSVCVCVSHFPSVCPSVSYISVRLSVTFPSVCQLHFRPSVRLSVTFPSVCQLHFHSSVRLSVTNDPAARRA